MSELNYNEEDEFDGLAEATEGNRTFRRFKSKSIAAKDWINDLIKNGYRSGTRRSRRALVDEGLFLSDEMQEVGVLSIAPSLSALLFELSLLHDKDDKKDESKKDEKGEGVTFTEMLTENKSSVLNVIISSVCKLLSECFPGGVKSGRNILLSSMPFYDDTTATEGIGWDMGGYLDSASWVFLAADSIESFLKRFKKVAPDDYAKLKWVIKGDKVYTQDETLTTEEILEAVRKLYLECINITCDCIIRKNGEVLGWSFRRMDETAEPSLYFSYVASTVYLGLYKRFNGDKGIIDNLRVYEQQLVKAENVKFEFFKDIADPKTRKKITDRLNREQFKEFANFLDGLSDEECQEIEFLYTVVNNGQPLTYKFEENYEDGSFTLLKNATVELAGRLWTEGFGNLKTKVPFKTNMAKGPCFEDGTLVDMDIVRLSSHNNAFFNNLFVIGIVLNSAYDFELSKKNPEEYNKMLNTFQLSIQNTQRCYNEIESEGLLYKIDSYILDFSDKVDSENTELAKQLRKVNIAAVPLLPLMLKNNNLMSQYVVQYPQKQMKESLKDIIRNKKRKDGESYWVWDKDGYNAITNYYYIDALISFYRYYEQYERPFVAAEDEMRTAVQRAVADEKESHAKELSDEQKKHSADIAWRDEYIAKTRKIFRGIAELVVNELIDIVNEQLTADNLLAGLDSDEKSSRDKIIKKLNSIDKDTDAVKLSTLVHLTEKLQLLSLLSMQNDDDTNDLLKNGSAGSIDAHSRIISTVFGENGNPSGFMQNFITKLVPKPLPDTKKD